jgi:ABC-2 type transport system permease protein
MLPSAPASSISTSRAGLLPANGVAYTLQVALASWRTMIAERLRQGGVAGYLAIWVVRPIFELTLAALVYGRGRPDLLRYATVALAANMAVSNTIYFVGEILDRERVKGTLVGLFLAPCARFSWLTGFALVGVVETVLAAAVALLFGRYAFGVRFDPDYPALALSLALFLASLWGMGLVFSAIGLYLKKANPFSNVVSPFTVLLGGAYYPVALLPAWLRYPARALPLGYGMQALADATLYHAGIRDLASQLLPLAGFALVLPVAGVAAFAWVERLVRERGELDLY